MLLPIDLHHNAIADLNAIKQADIESWGVLVVLIRELKCDPNLQQQMLNHQQYEETDFGIVQFEKWVSQNRKRNELWRVKVLDPQTQKQALPYRVVYAMHPWSQTDPRVYFQILGIVHRSFGYDSTNEVTQRIVRDYNELRELFC